MNKKFHITVLIGMQSLNSTYYGLKDNNIFAHPFELVIDQILVMAREFVFFESTEMFLMSASSAAGYRMSRKGC